jgi:hypothetical protein
MHRRMSLGVALLLLVVVFAGAGSASAEPKSAPGKAVAGSFDPLGWAWEWVASLLGGELDSNWAADGAEGTKEPGGILNSVDAGVFIDPNG